MTAASWALVESCDAETQDGIESGVAVGLAPVSISRLWPHRVYASRTSRPESPRWLSDYSSVDLIPNTGIRE